MSFPAWARRGNSGPAGSGSPIRRIDASFARAFPGAPPEASTDNDGAVASVTSSIQ